MNVAYELIHSLPGRIRVRVKAMRGDRPLAAGLQQLLGAQSGVREARANADCASVTISFVPQEFDPISWLDRLALEEITRVDLKASHRNGPAEARHHPYFLALKHATFAFESRLPPKTQFFLGAAALASTVVEAPALITSSILSAALLPILNRAVQTLLDERRVGADALDGISCLMLMQQRSFLPAALMTSLIGLGELIRDLATSNCQRLIAHQLALSKRSVWLVKENRRLRVPVSELHAGDRIVVYPGELIAVAGTISAGEGTIVPASAETDFLPQSVRTGDQVSADHLLIEGKLYILNDQSAPIERHDPVREKQNRRWLQRTRLHRTALRAGYDRVLPVMSVAALFFAATRNLHQAAAIICFDFITGIRIAIPTAVLSSMYRAGMRGIVIRNASALERLAEIDVIVFLRSGTLTALKPSVTDVFVCDDRSLEEVTRLAAAVEQQYSHLGAYAIYSCAKVHTSPLPERTTSKIIAGLGVIGEVEGHTVLVGSTRMMEMKDIDLSAAEAATFLEKCKQRGDSRVCVAVDGKLACVIAYQDPLRPEARQVVASLKRMGIREIAMTTGGSQVAAEALARKAGIAKVHFRTLPEDQARIVTAYKHRGLRVAVVGHDADDSLALEQADLAITLSTGADAARYRADIVLTAESLTGLVEGIEIARDGMALARQNLMVVSIPNWLGLALSITGAANFVVATVLNNGSVIAGAANGLRPLLDNNADAHLDDELKPNGSAAN